MESAVVVDPYANFRSRIGCSPVEEQKIYALLCLYPFDVRAEFLQFFVKMFVAAVDVIHAATNILTKNCRNSARTSSG